MAKKSSTLQGASLELEKIKPITFNQKMAFESDRDLILHGVAGTGKTFISSYFGFKDMQEGRKKKLIIIRSAVPTRDMGFLPGNMNEKASVYEEPYKDISQILFNRGDAYEILKKHNLVHFMTTSFIRGITLRDATIIVDECQNMSFHELDSIITRVGPNCRIMFCGDFKQADLKNNSKQLGDFFFVLERMRSAGQEPLFDRVEFDTEDIVRDEFVKSYIIAKERAGL